MLGNTDGATFTMMKPHPEINLDLLSNLRCHLAPKKLYIKTKFDTDYFDICANSGASSFATPDEIDFKPGTYKHLNGVAINGIAEGLKVSVCGSVS